MKGHTPHHTALTVRRPRRRGRTDLRWCTERRLVLVDIENIVGGACDTSARARWARHRLENVVGLRHQDQVVVGVDGGGVVCAASEWPGARAVIGKGKDGADRALLEVLAEDLPSRYRHVVLASGDGIFAEAVAELTRHGLDVTVVAHESGLSRRLREAATRVVLLSRRPEPQPPSTLRPPTISCDRRLWGPILR
ncbi:MAG TPA: NYN domain-containing protein [Nocardioidaceae bacterium]|nr:NYN domain-containing protein [Nocardioidaceae bacterium]